jgi:hypothetical protein
MRTQNSHELAYLSTKLYNKFVPLKHKIITPVQYYSLLITCLTQLLEIFVQFYLYLKVMFLTKEIYLNQNSNATIIYTFPTVYSTPCTLTQCLAWLIYSTVSLNNRNNWQCNPGLDTKQEITKLLLMVIILGSLYILAS